MFLRRTVEIWVGIFIVLGISALLLLALKVSGLNDVYQTEKGYKIYADFTNIGGLKPKAKVAVGGVVVGRVTKIQLLPEEFVARVTIFLRDNVRSLPADTRASILTAGLLGDNFIGLFPGFDEEFLHNGENISLENTTSALQLEELISKFVANQASKTE